MAGYIGRVIRPGMFGGTFRAAVVFGLLVCAGSPTVLARDLRITIPRHSELTPVQRLNRGGVDAVLKHQYEKAEGLFYKAYLYDPADPFTLNNLGYVSELQGQLDRAERFYKLAGEQGCYAMIDRSDAEQLKGKPMIDALGSLKDIPMKVNRINVLGIELLSQERGFEAESLLQGALGLDPKNPFTLNNLGVAEEAIGDFEGALKFYDQAAASRRMEPVVITLKRSWRGKPISEMAAASAQELRKRMEKMDVARERATMLAMRGVSATNRNDWSAAKQDFLDAYALDPRSAFTLNNLGYVAERDGDAEKARSYYAAARKADDADARVGLSTQSSAQGRHLGALADDSFRDVDNKLAEYGEEHRKQQGPVELKRRGTKSDQPATAPSKPAAEPPSPDPSTEQTSH